MAIAMVTGPVHCWVIVPRVTSFPINFSKSEAITPVAGIGAASGAKTTSVPLVVQHLSQQAIYLGTCERAPRVVKRRTFVPVHNDLAGPALPFDDIYTGAEGWIFGVFTRWNEFVYRTIASCPFPGDTEGVDPAGSRGTLMMTEGAGFGLILRYPHYDLHPLMSANGMAAGERYPLGYLKGEDTHEPGNSANKRHLAFYAMNAYIPSSNSFVLLDHDMTGIPALAPE